MIRKLLPIFLLSGLLLTGCVIPTETPAATGASSSATCASNNSDSTSFLSTEQSSNAAAIAAAAATLGLSPEDTRKATEIGEVVALTESELKAVNYGDVMNGAMTSSRGLFQQLSAWGPLADRLDPTKSALMFYNGGAAGQKGLLDITGWQGMAIHVAAQAVQLSQFADGSNFARNVARGQAIAASFTCTVSAGAVLANGVSVTLPSNEFVSASVRGKTIMTPNAGVAKGIAAGLSHLGKPYVWGGGGDGSGPNNGCTRGGGAKNSCGSTIGFDCSGLTAYVLKEGGFASPGGDSGSQRGGGQSVSYAEGAPGDIVGFPGHVAIFLGSIDGTFYILEASDVGIPVHVVALTRSDRDPVLHRYWTSGATT